MGRKGRTAKTKTGAKVNSTKMPDKCASCDPCCLSPVQYIASLRLESEPMFGGRPKYPTTFKIIVTVKVAYQL